MSIDWTQWLPTALTSTSSPSWTALPEQRTQPSLLIDTLKDRKKVFISYAREDFNKAKRLYNDLRAAAVDPWLDRESILPGQKWKGAIRSAIKTSRYFVA